MYLMRSIDQIEGDIVSAYGSISKPNWSFVEKRHASDPYRHVRSELSKIAQVQETTDLNDDVSLALSISCTGGFGLCLRLSLVGPYACVARADGVFLHPDELAGVPAGREIIRILKASDIMVIPPRELEHEISFGCDELPLYAVLFSTDEAIV